jgi:hypothetical protein
VELDAIHVQRVRAMANILQGREAPMSAADFARFQADHRDSTKWLLGLPMRRPCPAAVYGALGVVHEAREHVATAVAGDLLEDKPGTAGGALAGWLDATLEHGKRRPAGTVADATLWVCWRHAEGLPVTRVQSERTGRDYWTKGKWAGSGEERG